jgi:hypothetical protein
MQKNNLIQVNDIFGNLKSFTIISNIIEVEYIRLFNESHISDAVHRRVHIGGTLMAPWWKQLPLLKKGIKEKTI